MTKNWQGELKKYIDEAVGLGLFMISASFFVSLMQYPGLPFRHWITSGLLRQFFIGLAMGLTALYIFTSRFGKQSGAYINPAITVIRFRLGDIGFLDAIGYTIFQLIGGSLGVYLIALLFPAWMANPDVNYVVTAPGKPGIWVAFALEFFMSFLLIAVVLFMGMKKKWDRFTPYVVSAMITLFITFEAPYSGMSINPARTFASAVVADDWKSFWLYCTAPLLGMLLGEMLYIKTKKYFVVDDDQNNQTKDYLCL